MIKILMIENHEMFRAGLSSLLNAEENINIIACTKNGGQAMDLLKNGLETDIILTDLNLGDTNAITLSQNLQQTYPNIKMIILTLEADERYMAQAFRAGAKGYMLKETEYDELVYGIRKVYQNKYFICTGLTERLSKRLANEREYHQPTAVIDLSNREAEILNLLADGFTNLEIAEKLFTSRRTVEGHRQSLLNKAGVRNTPELIKFAILNGLLELSPAN